MISKDSKAILEPKRIDDSLEDTQKNHYNMDEGTKKP